METKVYYVQGPFIADKVSDPIANLTLMPNPSLLFTGLGPVCGSANGYNGGLTFWGPDFIAPHLQYCSSPAGPFHHVITPLADCPTFRPTFGFDFDILQGGNVKVLISLTSLQDRDSIASSLHEPSIHLLLG